MKSKIDRLEEVVRRAIAEAIDERLLDLYRADCPDAANTMIDSRTLLIASACNKMFYSTYRRLEVADIIEGRRRACPNPEPKP